MATLLRSSTNPALNEKAFERIAADEPGWAVATQTGVDPYGPAPIARTDAMTVNGTVWATAALLVLVVGAGTYGWSTVDVTAETVTMPGWLLPAVFGALGVAMVTIFKPGIARFTAPIYALLEGALLGAISGLYNTAYDGIVLQAVGLTVGVFAVMLFLYGTRIIKVTEKMRMAITAAMGAIMLVYVAEIILNLFDSSVPFLHDSGPIGIGISLLIVGVASFRLLLSFDFIERGVAAGAPRKTEWYAAFGLLVSIVWLYLELLRLLALLQGGGRR